MRLEDLDEAVLGSALAFIYHGETTVARSDLETMIRAATRLQITSLLQQCIKIFAGELSPQTAIDTYELAEGLGILELGSLAKATLCSRFAAVVEDPSFLRMPSSLLHDVVATDSLRCKEGELLKAVLRWVGADKAERIAELATLLPKIRFPLMQSEFISDVVFNEPLVTMQPCWEGLALEAYRFQTSARAADAESRSARTYPRTGCAELYAVGGQCGNGADVNHGSVPGTVSRFCPERGTWEAVAPLSTARSKTGVCSWGYNIFCAGGSTATGALSDVVERYCPLRDTWRTVAALRRARLGLGLAAAGEAIYAVGGSDNFSASLSAVDRYDIHTNTWVSALPTKNPRLYAGVTELDGALYVAGGCAPPPHPPRAPPPSAHRAPACGSVTPQGTDAWTVR